MQEDLSGRNPQAAENQPYARALALIEQLAFRLAAHPVKTEKRKVPYEFTVRDKQDAARNSAGHSGPRRKQAMARSARSSTLETRSARLRLPVAKKPVFVKIGPGVGLGYRRNRTAGTWVARVSDGKRGNWTKAIGHADDFDDADGTGVLDFWQRRRRRAPSAGSIAAGATRRSRRRFQKLSTPMRRI